MTAGMNLHFRIIRMVYSDDEVGGSYPTGTILHDNIEGRLDEEPVRTEYLQQGLETKKIFSAMLRGHNLAVREQDEIVVTSPPNHRYYGKYFRVITHEISNNHPAQKRNVHLLKLARSQIAHAEVFQ